MTPSIVPTIASVAAINVLSASQRRKGKATAPKDPKKGKKKHSDKGKKDSFWSKILKFWRD